MNWAVSKTPTQKTPDKPMRTYVSTSVMFQLKHLEEIHFLEPAVWVPWLERP